MQLVNGVKTSKKNIMTNIQETITIKLKSGRYYKTFNAYNKTYRISQAEALESINNAKANGSLFNEMKDWWTYFN